MIFVDEIWRVGRSAPLINSKFPAIIISKHRAKTPRTKKEKKNWEQLLPITPFPPPHSDEILFLLRGSAEFFYTTSASLPGRRSLQEETMQGKLRNFSLEKLEGKSHFFLVEI